MPPERVGSLGMVVEDNDFNARPATGGNAGHSAA